MRQPVNFAKAPSVSYEYRNLLSAETQQALDDKGIGDASVADDRMRSDEIPEVKPDIPSGTLITPGPGSEMEIPAWPMAKQVKAKQPPALRENTLISLYMRAPLQRLLAIACRLGDEQIEELIDWINARRH